METPKETKEAPSLAAPADEKPAAAETKTEEKVSDPGAKAEVKFDLKLPEGSPLDASHVEKIATLARERGLSQETAQALLERESAQFVETRDGIIKKLDSDWKAQEATWIKANEADKEIGGADFKKNIQRVHVLVKKFGSESFVKTLNETGLGNQPELVRFCLKIAKEMKIGEDQLQTGGQPAGATQQQDTMAKRFYGGTTPGAG